jgi:uncharacterized membrane protein YgcG
MDAQLEAKLIECLSALESGEALEHILSRYPEDAAQLRSLLEVAAALPLVRLEPSPAAQAASRRAFLAQAQTLRATSEPRRFQLFPARLAAVLAALVLAFIFVGGVVAASAAALPGDRLYGVKRGVEDARLRFAPASEKEALAKQFEQERRDEVGALLQAGRQVSVIFSGPIGAIQPEEWQVGGLRVHVSPSTLVEGVPMVGLRARVTGSTDDGRVLAVSILIEPGGVPAITPTATHAPTHTPAPTSTRTATPRPTLAPTFTPTLPPTSTPEPTNPPPPTPQPTVERQPTPVPTAAPAPTDLPAPPGNGNDDGTNDNQNGNDDHGGDNQNGNDDHGGDNQNGNDGGDGTNDNQNGNDDHSGHGGDSGGSDGEENSGGDHGGSGGQDSGDNGRVAIGKG